MLIPTVGLVVSVIVSDRIAKRRAEIETKQFLDLLSEHYRNEEL